MTRLNLTNLETVCCIGRLGSFSAAARRLNASQPAVTARVRELEQSVGFALFQRRGRRMELTVDGRQFVARVEPLLAQLDETVRTHAQPEALQGVVRIGLGATSMSAFPDVVAQLKRELPRVHYDIEVDMGTGLLARLEAGTLDLALVAGTVTSPRLAVQALTPYELRWLMSPSRARVSSSRPLALGELLDTAPLWLVARPSPFFARAQQTLRRHGAHLRNVNTCADTRGLIELILRTDGIGLVPTVLAAPYLERGALVPVSPALRAEHYPMTLAWHADQRQTMLGHVIRRIVDCDAALGEKRAHEEARLGSPAPPPRRRGKVTVPRRD